MTKGNSVAIGTEYGNFIRGNKDKLMISYRREPSHDYTMMGACGVLFEGEIHFFGGYNYTNEGTDLSRQHFVIETKRRGQLVQMTKKEDLDIEFLFSSCSSFEMTSEYIVVILCFDFYQQKSCFSFDGDLTQNINGDSNYEHYYGALTRYKSSLLAVGGFADNQKTEILKRDENINLRWSVVEPDFEFNPGNYIYDHSLVTVESSDINEEYVCLIGGVSNGVILDNVFKFNGTWSSFGRLIKPRRRSNLIYWNGAGNRTSARVNFDTN